MSFTAHAAGYLASDADPSAATLDRRAESSRYKLRIAIPIQDRDCEVDYSALSRRVMNGHSEVGGRSTPQGDSTCRPRHWPPRRRRLTRHRSRVATSRRDCLLGARLRKLRSHRRLHDARGAAVSTLSIVRVRHLFAALCWTGRRSLCAHDGCDCQLLKTSSARYRHGDAMRSYRSEVLIRYTYSLGKGTRPRRGRERNEEL